MHQLSVLCVDEDSYDDYFGYDYYDSDSGSDVYGYRDRYLSHDFDDCEFNNIYINRPTNNISILILILYLY